MKTENSNTVHQQQQQEQKQQQQQKQEEIQDDNSTDTDTDDELSSYDGYQQNELLSCKEQQEQEENELRLMIFKEFENNRQQKQKQQLQQNVMKEEEEEEEQQQPLQATINNIDNVNNNNNDDNNDQQQQQQEQEQQQQQIKNDLQQVESLDHCNNADNCINQQQHSDHKQQLLQQSRKRRLQEIEDEHRMAAQRLRRQQQEQQHRKYEELQQQQQQQQQHNANENQITVRQMHDCNNNDYNNDTTKSESDSEYDDDDDVMDDEDYVYNNNNNNNNITNSCNDEDCASASICSTASGSSRSLYTNVKDTDNNDSTSQQKLKAVATTVINLNSIGTDNNNCVLMSTTTTTSNNNTTTEQQEQSKQFCTTNVVQSLSDIKTLFSDDDPLNFTVNGILDTISTGKCSNVQNYTTIIEMSPPSPPFYESLSPNNAIHNDNEDDNTNDSIFDENDNKTFSKFQQSILEPNQKRALGFMYEIEIGRLPIVEEERHALLSLKKKKQKYDKNTKRGGWLAMEQNNSAAVVVIALICSNQFSHNNKFNINNNNNNNQPNTLIKMEIISESNVISLEQDEAAATAAAAVNRTNPTSDTVVASTTREIVQNMKAYEKQYFLQPIINNQSSAVVKITGKHIDDSLLVKVKATVIITSNSLLGYWEDLFTKHSPTLIVERYHPPSKDSSTIDLKLLLHDTNNANVHTARKLKNADVIITTSTFTWPKIIISNIVFHRIILHESHLLGSTGGHNFTNVSLFQSSLRWCISSTPFGKVHNTCPTNTNTTKKSSSILSKSMSLQSCIQKQIDFIGCTYVTSILFNQCLRACDEAIAAKKMESYVGWNRKQRNVQFYNFVYMLSNVMYRRQQDNEYHQQQLQQHHLRSVSTTNTGSTQSITRSTGDLDPKITIKKKLLKLSAIEANAYHTWLSQDIVQSKLKKFSYQALGCTVNELEGILYYYPKQQQQQQQMMVENNFKITKVKKLVKYLKHDLKQRSSLTEQQQQQQTNICSEISVDGTQTRQITELGTKILILTSDRMMQTMCYRSIKEIMNNKCYIYRIGGKYSNANHCDTVLRKFQLPLSKPIIVICLWKPKKKTFGFGSTSTCTTTDDVVSSLLPVGIVPSKLYCMEPWIDPSYQKQATQLVCQKNNNKNKNKKCIIVQFIYKDTFEENIDKLHIRLQSLCDNNIECNVYTDDSPPSCYINDGIIGLDATRVITTGLLL